MAVAAAATRIALDLHAHLAPIMPERLAALPAVEWRAAELRLTLDGHAVGPKPLFQPEALLRWMDEQGVAQTWVSIPPPLYRQALDAEAARRWVDYVNDGLTWLCDGRAERLAPLLHLPTEHPAVAQAVAEAAIARGARRFSGPAGGRHAHVFSGPEYAGLWQALDDVGAFLFLHPASCADGRLAAFYLENLLGNPHETAVAAAHLMFGGVCERYPRIRFCLAHGGGTAGLLAGRFQQGFASARPGVDTGRAAPRDLLPRFRVDSILHDPKAVEFAAVVFGPDHVLFGSDWPFPMGLLTPHEQLAAVEPGLRKRILRTNAGALMAPPG